MTDITDPADDLPDVDQTQEFGAPVDEPEVLVDPDDDEWGFDEGGEGE